MTRWPQAIVLMVLGIIYATLLEDLLPGPSFLPIVFVAALLGPLFYAELRGYYHLSRLLGLGLISLATIAIGAIVLDYASPLGYKPPPQVLFSQAFIVWIANIMTFAIWYWEIDSGGPERRKTNTSSYQSEDFLFPQISQDQGNAANWSPGLLDYLYLAFNFSKSARVNKRYRECALEVTGTGYADFTFTYELGYASTVIPQPGTQSVLTSFSSAVWDAFVWDAFQWDGSTLMPAIADMEGTAENVSIIIRGSSDYHEAIRFSGAFIHFTPRRVIH